MVTEGVVSQLVVVVVVVGRQLVGVTAGTRGLTVGRLTVDGMPLAVGVGGGTKVVVTGSTWEEDIG